PMARLRKTSRFALVFACLGAALPGAAEGQAPAPSEAPATEGHPAPARESGAEELATPPSVTVTYGNDGVAIRSADGKFQFRLRPVVQADARFFAHGGSDTFLLRRVRPALQGTAFEFFDWRILPELAGTPNLQEAYVNVRFIKAMQLRGGKFKPPV